MEDVKAKNVSSVRAGKVLLGPCSENSVGHEARYWVIFGKEAECSLG